MSNNPRLDIIREAEVIYIRDNAQEIRGTIVYDTLYAYWETALCTVNNGTAILIPIWLLNELESRGDVLSLNIFLGGDDARFQAPLADLLAVTGLSWQRNGEECLAVSKRLFSYRGPYSNRP